MNLPNTVEAVSQVIKGIAELNLNDGVRFDTSNLKAQEIIEAANYKGIRVEILARFEDAFETMQLDLSFGNAITPAPVELSFPSLLGTETHSLLAYPLETIVAEKLAAAIEIGEGNTRLKDFYDVYWILEHETIRNDSLTKALERTFAARETPGDRRQALERLDSTRAQAAWTAFLSGSPVEAPALFSEVLESILNTVGDLLEDGS